MIDFTYGFGSIRLDDMTFDCLDPYLCGDVWRLLTDVLLGLIIRNRNKSIDSLFVPYSFNMGY